MASLYRKYRPTDFNEILGQNYIKIILQNEIASGKIAHAYLFCGPRAVGKTTMARVFAKAVNCVERKEGEYEPCNKCASCLSINSGQNLDIIEIDAASNTGVDNVRENVISSSRVAPGGGNKYKVFIIDEVHMLSISAFNALLKVLEEPPKQVIFILCTTEIHKVPETIISRCQRFDFKRISVSDMVKKLEYIVKMEKIKVDKSILESLARHAGGYLRDAESLLGQIIAVSGKEITQEEADLVIPRSDLNEIVKLLEYISKKDVIKGIKLINDLLDGGANLKGFVEDAISILRKLIIAKISPSLGESLGLDWGESVELKITAVAKEFSLEELLRAIDRLSLALNEIKTSFIIQLPLELAVIDLCQGKRAEERVVEEVPVQNIYTPKVPIVEKGVIDKEKVIAKWQEFLIKLKPYNHSLSFVLQSCQVKEVSGSIVKIAFKYKFHKDRIDSPQIKTLLEKSLNEVYGLPLSLEAVIDESLSGAENKDDNENLNNLLKTFGGELLN